MMRSPERDHEYACHPRPGDYWHEMLCGVLVVADVSENFVIVFDKKKPVDKGHWTWDLERPRYLTRDQFRKRLEYSTMPGKYFATVEPGAHQWVPQAWAERHQ